GHAPLPEFALNLVAANGVGSHIPGASNLVDVDDDGADIVFAAGSVGTLDERGHRAFRRRRIAQIGRQRFGSLNHFPEPIATEEKTVAWLKLQRPRIDGDVVEVAEGAGNDVA